MAWLTYLGFCLLCAATYSAAVRLAFRWTRPRPDQPLATVPRAELEGHTLEAFCQYLESHPDQRQQFVRECLLTQPSTLDPTIFPDDLTPFVAHFVSRLDDAELVRLMAYLQPTSSALAARSRERRRRYISVVQGSAALVGALVLILMLLRPPWLRQREHWVRIVGGGNQRHVILKESVGYPHWLAGGLPDDQVLTLPTRDLRRFESEESRYRIALGRLSLQAFLVTLLVILVFAISGRSGESRSSKHRSWLHRPRPLGGFMSH